jgi:hypothetical protein
MRHDCSDAFVLGWAMSLTLVMRCPSTGEMVLTGILVNSEMFKELVENGSQIRCPACGQAHPWTKDTARSIVDPTDVVLGPGTPIAQIPK